MVRETRHLWVGNLPENIREDRIRDHFKRYGRVQSVKLLPRAKGDEGSGLCATVSFMDIKSASKAHNNEQTLEERTLSTEYHEPAAIPGSATAAPIYYHGPPEEISTFDRSSHFYDRRDGDAYLRRASSTYHVTAAEPVRGRARDRHYRDGPYAPTIESVVSRQTSHHRNVGSNWNYDTPSRYPQPSTTPDVYADDRRDLTPVVVVHKKNTKSRSGSNGSESGSSVSRSRSSSTSSQSGSSSCTSASSSPGSDKSSHHGSLRTLQSAVSTPHTNNSSPAVHSEDRRPLAICVRNLPARSSDTSLKDGLFHEYKKHGKVTWVKVVGQGSDRYALVCFKKPDDVEKALQVSHDKLFFGCKIEVAPYQGYDVDDNEFRFVARPYEAEQDEFHPKATRTLFIGNLEKDITAPELRKHFDQFGEIIEIDIKKQGSNSSYAFCQYCDIGSVVRAMRTLDGEHLGNNRIKLGFGKSLHTNCVWVDGVAESVTEKYLSLQFSQFGPVSHIAIDRVRGHALVFYDQIPFAQSAVKEMRGVALRGRKLQVDFASRECQEAFYDHLEKQTGHNTTFDNSLQVSPPSVTGPSSGTRGFETPSSSSSSSGGGGGACRYPRYSAQTSVGRSYPRGAVVSPSSTPARPTPRHITATPRFDFNSDYRPYRSYEEMSLEDGGAIVTVTVGQGPQELRHLQKERVALLEQLEDCASSGEEGSSRRRCKHRRSHSGEGSRPGTPLCDERPENLPPVEPRRAPRERPPDPLSLPLPRFATQLMSPRPAPPSPLASPSRTQSTSSDDSEPSPPSPEWEERLRSLDEKYEKWSGSRTIMAKVDPTSLRVRHKLLDLDLHELQPSDIVKSVLAKRSVFDEDSKRLANFGEKYEPQEFVPMRSGFTTLRPRLGSPTLLHSPTTSAAASPGGAKGLQYPFPSHPPVQPTTSVATTTAAMSVTSCSSLNSGITTLSTSVDSSKSPQTFSTTSVSTVISSRSFLNSPPSFHLPPKISPPLPEEKKTDNIDPLLRFNYLDKPKHPQKLLQANPLTDKSEVNKKYCVNTAPLLSSKPLKSCLRRESGDEKREMESRRKSREDDMKVYCLSKDSDAGSESGVVERRRSLSDPRRRASVELNKQSLQSESDKQLDRINREEIWRKDSVDISPNKDSEISRLSDRINEQSDNSDCSKLSLLPITKCSDSSNLNFITQHDVNLRHSQPTDTLEKKKDCLQICPERNRRRGRESIDSIDNCKYKVVPESLDVKNEFESSLRHKDSTEKSDPNFKNSIVYIEKRKDSGHTEIVKNNELCDRKIEKLSLSHEDIRYKNKCEEIDIKKERECDGFKYYSGTSLCKELTFKGELDHCQERVHKTSGVKKESDNLKNHIDSSSKRQQLFSESFHNSNKPKEIEDIVKFKDMKKENDLSSTSNIRHKDNIKYNDYKKDKDIIRNLESDSDCEHHGNELRIGEDTEVNKFISQDSKKESEMENYSKQTNFEYTPSRFKDHDRKKDGGSKLKYIERSLHNDVNVCNKQKHCNKQLDVETTNKISEWVEEIRKDLENSGYRMSENRFDQVLSEKKTDSYVNDKKKDGDNLYCKDYNKEDFELTDNEQQKRNKQEDCRFFGGKVSDTREFFRRKEITHKKDLIDFDYKLEESNKRKDDFVEHCKNKFSVEILKDTSEKDNNKLKSSDLANENYRTKEWHDETLPLRHSELEKHQKHECDVIFSEKDIVESNPLVAKKDTFERFEKKVSDWSKHNEEEDLRQGDCLKKDKKKERLNSWPTVIGIKRRLSSQDSTDGCVEDSKKCKPERRDSKDSGRSSSSSKKSSYEKHKSFTKLLEEKIKEDKERELIKMRKDDELSFEILKSASKKDKKNTVEKIKFDGIDRKNKVRAKENGITASESEAGSGDDGSKTPKRHSIFDIVDEEPAYISMYDKVKARSTKNMQKQEEEKRQERLKEKFNQLKQSRAKREEKKRSTSYDEDSDSERGGRRSNKLLITSSEDDACSENDIRTKGRKIMSDTSEDDLHRHPNSVPDRLSTFDANDNDSKQIKGLSDTSEDDSKRIRMSRNKACRTHQIETKIRKILSDTSEDDIMKHSVTRNKSIKIQSDESEIDLGYEDEKKGDVYVQKPNDYVTSDLFSNISEDPEHPTNTDFERENADNDSYLRNSIDSNTSDIPRKKSHKKKQKRQKNAEASEDSSNSKRHNSKNDHRNASYSHEGDDPSQTKNRKKKSENSKRDEKMEDIFGPLSDDSDNMVDNRLALKLYGFDSDDERQIIRKRDKKRKERKTREFDEGGPVLQVSVLNDTDSLLPSEEHTKSKKKKRKKSREEKLSKHHHHQRLEEEAAARANEADSEREPEQFITPPALPHVMESPPCVNQNKKPDIPGFGSQVDENIHETAVKSISESPTKPVVEETREPLEEQITSTSPEEKPTPVISQEETEDAVAALLMEDSFGGGFDSYTKPDTPVSEPDLQIDTDTEDTFDPIDFSKPPRTPDIPSSFYRQQDTREGLEERILALACPENMPNKDNEASLPNKLSSSISTNDQQTEPDCNPNNKNKTDSITSLVDSSLSKDLRTTALKVCNSKAIFKALLSDETGKRLDNSPVNSQNGTVKTQINSELVLDKNATQNKSAQSSSAIYALQIKAPTSMKPSSPNSSQLTNHSKECFQNVGDTLISSTLSSKLEPNRCSSVEISKQPNIVCSSSVNQEQKHMPRILSTITQEAEAGFDNSLSAQKSATQIVAPPPTSVAFVVQPQSKNNQSTQQSNSLLQISSKNNTPEGGSQEKKGNGRTSQYMLHHTLQSQQLLCFQSRANKVVNQQPPPTIQGQLTSGNTIPESAPTPFSVQSPGMPASTQSSFHQGNTQHQQIKQLGANHSQNQQLSVNVAPSHQVSANSLTSPNNQLNTNSHSPTASTFSPHQLKVSMTQQPSNSIHPTCLQQSSVLHNQRVSPQQQKIQQLSPVGYHHPLNKSNSPLLQQVPNCIGTIPLKPGTVQTIRHLSPASQPNSTNKMISEITHAGVQQLRTVVLQNTVKQTVAVLQPEPLQKRFGPPMIRPLNAPQPGVVHILKNDSSLVEKNKNLTETVQKSQEIIVDHSTVKTTLKPEDSSSLTTDKHESDSVVQKAGGKSDKEVKLNPAKIMIVDKKETTPSAEDAKPTNASVHKNLRSEFTQRSQVENSSTQAILQENKLDNSHKVNAENRPMKTLSEEIKPLNAVIQDLTFKAAQAKQISTINKELDDTSTSKPLDQVVKEINDRKKAAEPKDLTKYDNNVLSKQDTLNLTKLETKSKTIIESRPNEQEQNSFRIKEESKCVMEKTNEEAKQVFEQINQDTEKETLMSTSEITDVSLKCPGEDPKIEKLKVKKEEIQLHIDSIPPVPNQNDKPEVHSEETGSPLTADDANKKSESQLGLSIGQDESPTTGRGRGRRRKATGPVGGVVTRRARLNNNIALGNDMASTDVYEFRDDSEEEINRPRLILTIKSPDGISSQSNNNSATTRKSRRLQEKDGTKSTVDDTIEEVIRGTRSSRRTRTAVNCSSTVLSMETRKSPRRKHSATTGQSNVTVSDPGALATESEGEASEPVLPPASSPQPATQPPSTEPMTLIDPVTGLLIPMQEGEEGQYIPVHSDQIRSIPEIKKESEEPVEKRLKASELEPNLLARAGIPVKVPLNCAVVPPLPPVVTKAMGIVMPSGSIPRLPVAVTISAPSPLVKGCPTGANKASLTNVVGPMNINRVVAQSPVSPSAKPHINHKAHLLQAVVRTPLLTGSPPLRSQQPSTRVVKVETGGCIVVPTASTQTRMPTGLPSYEGDVLQPVSYPPHHIQPAHYVHPQMVYQQYLREAALTSAYHIPAGRVVKATKSEIEESVSGSPPLELRRGSPHDRTTDSPQVATVYVHGSRHLYYEPALAHRPSQTPVPVSYPPHGSPVPPQADTLLMLLQRYPLMWQGVLALKTDQAAVQMHFVFGNANVARDSLPCNIDGSTPPMRIAQRMRLEQTQVEGVARKMQSDNEHCMLLALPCGRDHMDVLQQSNNLQSGFITYLQQKQAAGIINIAGPGSQQAAYVVHIFPSCDFANESLTRIAPDLLHRVANIAHLLIVIATV